MWRLMYSLHLNYRTIRSETRRTHHQMSDPFTARIRATMKLRLDKIRSFTALAVSLGMVPIFAQAQDDVVGDADAARAKVSMCIGCHGIKGYKANFPEVYHVPKIAGQNAEYIVTALNDYASGARSFPSMEAIAQSLSSQDIADLAAYYSSLK